MNFLDIHSKTYGTIDKYYVLWQVNLKKYIFTDGMLFVYTEHKDYIQNNFLLFDINQTSSLRKTFKEFKKIVRSFDKPIYLSNVIDEFKRLAEPSEDGYVWKR